MLLPTPSFLRLRKVDEFICNKALLRLSLVLDCSKFWTWEFSPPQRAMANQTLWQTSHSLNHHSGARHPQSEYGNFPPVFCQLSTKTLRSDGVGKDAVIYLNSPRRAEDTNHSAVCLRSLSGVRRCREDALRKCTVLRMWG